MGVILGVLFSATVMAQNLPNRSEAALNAPMQVPEWVAWRVFYQAVIRASQRSADGAQQKLKERFALTADESAAVLRLGAAYVQALVEIDNAARRLVQEAYSAPASHTVRPRPGSPQPATPPILIRPGATSLLDMVQKDGVFDRITRSNEHALESHLSSLSAEVNPTSISLIRSHVQRDVTNSIFIASAGMPIDRMPSLPSPDTKLPNVHVNPTR
jgi:hypothetical protein